MKTAAPATALVGAVAADGTKTLFAEGLSGPVGITQLADGRVLMTDEFGGRVIAYAAR